MASNLEAATASAKIERQALRSQIERLQERVAELRALEIFAASKAGESR